MIVAIKFNGEIKRLKIKKQGFFGKIFCGQPAENRPVTPRTARRNFDTIVFLKCNFSLHPEQGNE